ncbi:MAG: alpha-ketoacid dehydrogenase subunit beta [Clostridiaceae bacterium]|nr:alpha-ketoacid dehydrogenase subunit beta [Clostridiaceae bacterium]
MVRKLSIRLALREAMRQEMENDETVFIMGEDVGVYQGVNQVTGNLVYEFGSERVMDTPISETAFLGAAVGAAMQGLKPIVELQVADFISVCLDPLLNQAAKIRFMSGNQINVPMVLRAAFGAGLGAAAQHSQSLEAFFCHIPGIKVVMPATAYDAKGLLISSIRDTEPIVFLEPRALYSDESKVPIMPYTIPLGKADVKRKGKDISIITYGSMLPVCLELSFILEKNYQIDCEVVDLRSLQPLDTDAILNSVAKTKRVIIVHEAVQFAGFGAEIAAHISQTDLIYELKSPIRRVGAKFTPIPFAKHLEESTLPQLKNLLTEILAMFELT